MTSSRVRHNLDLVLVAGERGRAPTRGRVVVWEDGRWRLSVPTRDGEVEVSGDRWSESRAVVRLLLRAALSSGGA